MTGVTLERVIKRYGDVQVIHGVDLTIKDGEFCVFVGHSGCGKSTLLRMVAGLEETSDGRISIGARDVTRTDPAERGVAMVFQTYALYPHMTVEENMGFGLRMNGHPKAEIARLHQEIGATMIYVTHDQVEAMTLADKIVVLRAGRIEQVGAPLDLYRDPDNRFVAGFIGSPSMNFLGGQVNGGAVEVPGLKRSVPTDVALPAAGRAVTVGLRPEHLVIDPAGETHRVELTEALGGVSYAYLVSDSGEKLIVEERGDERSRTGDRVGLSFDPARAFLFDAETEQRLR
jgi:ABC-type sugar transport system ATPase subunit